VALLLSIIQPNISPMLGSVLLLAFSALADANVIPRQDGGLAYSPPSYPTPWMDSEAEGWAEAYAKAKKFVSQLTLMEKVNLTTGVG
jgi:beta-glucosidase